MTEATAKLVTDNMGLIGMHAKAYLGRGVDFDDLCQEGSMGLIEAAKFFNEEIAKFTTYAGWWIKRFMSLACRTRHEVTIPEYIYRYFPTIERVRIILGADATDAKSQPNRCDGSNASYSMW